MVLNRTAFMNAKITVFFATSALLLLVSLSHVAYAQPSNRLKEAFGRLDSDGDGQLSLGEVGRSSRAKQRLGGADADDDGVISFDEFRRHIARLIRDSRSRSLLPKATGETAVTARSEAADQPPEPGSLKQPPDSDATRDAAGTGQLFEAIHVPGLTDFREGTNGVAFADFDGNGYLDALTVTTPPFVLDDELKGGQRPRDTLRLLLNHGGFVLRPCTITLRGSPATPDDFGQGWRGSQVPVVADFNDDGLLDFFVSRQFPGVNNRVRDGYTPVGNSLFLADGAYHTFTDVSRQLGVLNERAYNRQPTLGDVNRDGYLDIGVGADNTTSAFEGIPKTALLVYEPGDGGFSSGRYRDVGGTDLAPDFGGFYNDPALDKAGPKVTLRDIDNDGDLDLFQSTHVLINVGYNARRLPLSPAEYRQGVFTWRNMLTETGEFRFEKSVDNGLACEARLRFDTEDRIYVPAGEEVAPGLAYLFFADIDNDTLLDVLAVDGTDYLFTPKTEDVAARYWHNDGGFRFTEATEAAGLSSLNGTYADWYAFFENEVTSRLARPVPRGRMNRSQPGLSDKAAIEFRPYFGDVVVADFDNDTHVDFVALDRCEAKLLEPRAILYMNQGDGTFEPRPTTVSGLDSTGIASEAVDLNNDGRVDLFISGDPDNTAHDGNPGHRYEDKVYLNTGALGGSNHWLRLRFSGVSHAALLGTRIEIYRPSTDDRIGVRSIYADHAYKSGSPLEAHFGLGQTDTVDVRVYPLTGESFMLSAVEGDRYLDLNVMTHSLREVKAVAGPTANLAPSPAPGELSGFTFLREESFTCGDQSFKVKIYRCNLFAEALGLGKDETDIACEFVLIPGGRFTMGSTKSEQDAMAKSRPGRHPILDSNSRFYNRTGESPQHVVHVPAFLMARTEVTQQVWRGLAKLAGLPQSPSFFKNAGDRAPVEQVSWNDVTKWMQAINEAHGLSLRLPSEAEWEYACRAGTTTPIYNGPMTIRGHCDCPELDEIGWYMGNCGVDYEGGVNSSRWPEKQYDHRRAGTQKVGQKKENAFGLYDTIGNVMEWCEDHAHANYVGAPTDGSAWIGGDWIPGSTVNGPLSRDDSKAGVIDGRDVPGRVRRGGSWRQLAYNIRSAMRSFRGPNFVDSNQGFRVAATLPTDH